MKKILAVVEIMRELKTMEDWELMQKYGLCEEELKKFFDRFMKAVAAGHSTLEMEVKN